MTKKQENALFSIIKEGYTYELHCNKKNIIIGKEECEVKCESEKKKCMIWEKGTEFDQYYYNNDICPYCIMNSRSRGLMYINFKLMEMDLVKRKIPCCECYFENPDL
ncbi:MAG: hypothetical protein GF311_10720 [Candidatus Lokiarchaeota archaeon]|nr:hypothetical protein [Candidatus Lokiarchaeota archaeon]